MTCSHTGIEQTTKLLVRYVQVHKALYIRQKKIENPNIATRYEIDKVENLKSQNSQKK
jgi:hypothetical protein